ncbi:RING finger protein nhl-1-like [Uloborus diversus]|uniref:RING finger protein nhl-1-like n=1 Tax=Uloborus diversus TaxID=327109 RepID=UPI00240A98A7|nr:RING finger protein nhl-1-like [Uloborus diversus]
MSSAWFRMDQLLKCGICSERFRNPRLLPCNHTFCGEPCLERLAGSRQNIKCPECSAEHRVPGQGVQGFPNNVTLGRFLELRQQVSGHEPELPASMQRCNACGEKGRLEYCAHCKRKICPECRKAHVNILRKEVALINAQCREGLGQLCRALHDAEDNAEKLQKNYVQVRDEIEEVVRRYTHDLLGAESRLKQRLDAYLQAELKSMRRLEHDLQIELGNVHSNCDLVEKFVNNGVDWTDAELTDYKEIFQKTLDFLRAFDSDPTSDCVRKVRFRPREDPDLLHKTLLDFAEVRLTQEEESEQRSNSGDVISMNGGPTLTLTPPQNSLFRSQSDHKLGPHRNSQKRTNDRSEEAEPLSRRLRDRFGTRDSCERGSDREHSPSWRNSGKNGRDHDRREGASDDQEASTLEDGSVNCQPDHVTETEDATRGPLSGVIRILDSPHVMERLHNSEVKQKKQREEEERKANLPPPAPPPVPRPMTRQLSEDEIEKQKKENKAAAAAASSAASNKAPEARSPKTTYGTKDEDTSRSYTPKYSTPPIRNSTEERRGQQREETSSPRLRNWRTGNLATEREVSVSPPGSPTRGRDKPPVSPRGRDLPSRPPNRPFLTKSSSLEHDEPERRTTTTSTLASKRNEERPRLRLNIPPRAATPPSSSSSSSSSSESDGEAAEHEAARKGDISPSVNTLLARSAQARKQSASTQARILGQDNKERRSWRDAIRKEEEPVVSSRRKTSAAIEPEARNSKYSSILDRTRRSSITSPTTGGSRTAARDLSPEDSYTARRNRIARSKSSHDLYPAEDDNEEDTLSAIRNRYRTRRTQDKSPEEPPVPHSWSQYLKNKYGAGGRAATTGSGLVRSMTSASLAAPRSGTDSSDDDHPPRRRDYGRNRGDSSSPRGFSMPRRTYMQKGKTSLKFGSRGTENGHFTWPRGVCVGPDNTIVVADSNNHRVQVFSGNGKFLHSFGSYGTGEGEFDSPAAVTCNRIGQYVVSDRYNHRLQVFDSTGRFVRAFGGEGRADGKFSYPWGVATDNLGFVYVCDKDNHRIQVFQGDGTFVTKFGGGPGHRPGELHHPHYVAVSTTSRVVVSDADNHRVQAFDVNGRLLSTFGTEGGEESQFKYPRGVAVDEQGYLVVGDSGNNRIQVFHPDGTFLKSFGTWGSGEGEFKGLEGVAVTQSGQILVCDRENHRIQLF